MKDRRLLIPHPSFLIPDFWSSVAPPCDLGTDVFQAIVLLDGADDAETDVIGFGHPPDALRAWRITAGPIFRGDPPPSTAALFRRINPGAAAGYIWITVFRGGIERIQDGLVFGPCAVIILAVAIDTPLGHVAVHVVKTPGIGFFLPDLVGRLLRLLVIPAIIVQLCGIVAEAVGGSGAGPAGPFPFRLGRQAIVLAGLFRQPAAILHGGMMRDRQGRVIVMPVAKGRVGIRRSGTGDGVANLLRLLANIRPGRRLPFGKSLGPEPIVFVPLHLQFAHPERLDGDGVLGSLIGGPALL